MQHEHIHTLHITKSGEKQLFQIKLPKNAKKITGILVTIQPINDNKYVPVSDTPIPAFPIKEQPIKLPIKLVEATGLTSVKKDTAVAETQTKNNAEPLFPIEQAIS
jgi:hypothetical protein